MGKIKISCENASDLTALKEFANLKGLEIVEISEWVTDEKNEELPAKSNIISFPAKSSELIQTMSQVEEINIKKAIAACRGNLTLAAKQLNIGRATLYRKVKEYSIDTKLSRIKKAA